MPCTCVSPCFLPHTTVINSRYLPLVSAQSIVDCLFSETMIPLSRENGVQYNPCVLQPTHLRSPPAASISPSIYQGLPCLPSPSTYMYNTPPHRPPYGTTEVQTWSDLSLSRLELPACLERPISSDCVYCRGNGRSSV
ncbi:hypothetical protein Bbelb_309070 [Branchiostoma belcheri]|nr:hypothetical protein Bbelb_309070 [Branchiostoma belcheri]